MEGKFEKEAENYPAANYTIDSLLHFWEREAIDFKKPENLYEQKIYELLLR
ncbi:MAG: hypothetical protein QXM38_03350 [Candidatus Aenigmatarchaeota archaeon]